METVLKTINLTKTYRNRIVVDKINITINKGDIYGFLGRNGAGKTTTLKLIIGQSVMDRGSIEVFGERISSGDYKYKSRIGVLIDKPAFYPKLSARENLEIHRRCMGIQDKKRIDEVLGLVELSDTGKRAVEKFSMGMCQKLGLAKALLNYPELLILDEPTNGLDPVAIGNIRKIILKLNKEQNTTVLICSHILSEIQHLATKIGVIHNGALLEEFSYKDLMEQNKTYLQLRVNDQKKAAAILEENCRITKYKVYEEDIIRIFEDLDQPEMINKKMVENGVLVKELIVNRENLEDHFLRITAGEQNV